MAKKESIAGEKKRKRDAAKKKTTKSAEVARRILTDPDYPIFRQRFKRMAAQAARSKAALCRKKGVNPVDFQVEVRCLQYKEDLCRDIPEWPDGWLTAEKKMRAEETVKKRYET